jgi:hypothetical protein
MPDALPSGRPCSRGLMSRMRWCGVCGLVLLVFPAGAAASVSPLSATLETGDFSQFNMGAQTAGSGASVSVDTSRAYGGLHSARASYAGGGANNYARGVESVNWNDGDDVWYGEAVYLPVGFKSAMQGEVDLMRWDNYSLNNSSDDWGGVVIYGGDKRARLMRFNSAGDTAVLVGPFNIAEGQWNWIEVNQIFSQHNGQAYSAMYLNGQLVGISTTANKYSLGITRIRYGLVAISESAQTNPLSLWFDDAYLGTSEHGPLGSPTSIGGVAASVSNALHGETLSVRGWASRLGRAERLRRRAREVRCRRHRHIRQRHRCR